ncbi:MAG TPA: pyruvate, phosphate dikinase [Nitrososphaera sp.]|nr:pyruvate, phosphate dikinase [Nitrososphaera sp.]
MSEESSFGRAPAVVKPIYFFDETDGANKMLLGGKGAGLAEMTELGLPVPPGFIITTEICEKFYEAGRRLPDGLMDEVRKSIRRLEGLTGKRFGDRENPLLVSVRSGSPVSMPGMMDTILNLGLNDETVEGLVKQSPKPEFAWDTYWRFMQMLGKIILGIDARKFDGIVAGKDLSSLEVLKTIVASSKSLCEETGKKFPADPYKQLELAIDAVFRSWMGKRAVEYRKQYNITPDMAAGTAVTIVAMVFGNMGSNSCTGVVFTRDPETGEKRLYGDYLVNAQGEDVVSGKTTPNHIDMLASKMPVVYRHLLDVTQKLENHFKEPQDVEFTVEKGKLYILQTRAAKMNAVAAVKTSVDLYREGLISKIAALERINPEALEQLLYRRIDSHFKQKPIATGVGASPGAASGSTVFDIATAEDLGKKGEKVILVREETKPDDVPAFFQSIGILTSRGGKTSHAAVVARGMGKPCIVGCSQIEINADGKSFSVNGGKKTVTEGEKITIDGSTGRVYVGELPTVEPEISSEFKELLQWSSEMKGIKIRANADTVESAALAHRYGAEGIGLCRTERMFNHHDRIVQFVNMIMAEDEDERRQALAELEPLQRSDFKAILREMKRLPVTIRLLDPPLHEFLPKEEDLMQKIFELKSSGSSGSSSSGGGGPGGKTSSEIARIEKILHRVHELSEINPMLGHRGVRLGISFPEIYETQIRSICEAAADLSREGIAVEPQIMVPQIGLAEELAVVRQIFESVKREVEHRNKVKLKIKFGSMIEVVRACLVADEIAHLVDFISFGTNDLTQATFSFSREDAEGKFLPFYLEKGIVAVNPFQSVDTKGVGRLMKIAIDMSRAVKKDIEIGICGEHGGDPKSIEFCSNIGLDYVSASSHRIPIAILAAAQSAIKQNKRLHQRPMI